VEALEEAITIVREVWGADKPGGVVFDGQHYRAWGAPRGPAPPQDVEIWVGAGMLRMLRLVGRRADGWSVPIRLFLAGHRLRPANPGTPGSKDRALAGNPRLSSLSPEAP
jgi:alkanesulfonate monooxygenase SsuD/methylene tetrahydromethanopterin reductase-like flavin-dependent oxidoreductase (luciferase family)